MYADNDLIKIVDAAVTPKEYLKALRSKSGNAAPRPELPPSVVRLAQSIGMDPGALAKRLEGDGFADYLYAHLRPRLPTGFQQLFADGYLAIGSIEQESPEAYVTKVSEAGYAIVFHTGLKDFVYRLARVLATHFFPSDGSSDHQVPDFAETARIMAEIFWWFQESGTAFGPSYSISDEQIQLATMLATEAEIFLLAHEIGHVIADTGLPENLVERFVAFGAGGGHHEEHAADAIGLQIALGTLNPDGAKASELQLRYAGVEFALRVFCTLETLGFKFQTTHPKASRRLDFIRTEIGRLVNEPGALNSLTVLADAIGAMFDAMASIMSAPGEHDAFYRRSAAAISSELAKLLAACTGGLVPDYVRFYQSAGAVFEKGYSHVLLKEVAITVHAFITNNHVETAQYPQHAWRNFQQFKLLWSFIDQYMNEPARSVFLSEFASDRQRQ